MPRYERNKCDWQQTDFNVIACSDPNIHLIDHNGGRRDLFLVSTKGKGGHGDQSALELVSYTNGVRTEKLLGYCENHGEWLQWLAE